jgi:hypothetical protein
MAEPAALEQELAVSCITAQHLCGRRSSDHRHDRPPAAPPPFRSPHRDQAIPVDRIMP